MNLSYPMRLPLALVLAGSGCIMDKQLGGTGSTDSTTENDTDPATGSATAQQDTDGASMTGMASLPTTDATLDTEGSAEGPATMTTDREPTTAASEETGPVPECIEWTPPPIECELPGAATVDVQGDSLESMIDEACTIDAVQSVDTSTDAVTIDCAGEVYTLQIATDNPHLTLPFSVGQDVLVSGAQRSVDPLMGVRSFTIRATTGELLLAWLNQIAVNEAPYEPDVDIAPVVFNPAASGCQPADVAQDCEADSVLMVQRVMLEFGNGIVPIVVFDGNQAIVPTDDADMSVIVASARRIVCWDPDCAIDDSGPFDETRLLLVALPSG